MTQLNCFQLCAHTQMKSIFNKLCRNTWSRNMLITDKLIVTIYGLALSNSAKQNELYQEKLNKTSLCWYSNVYVRAFISIR